MFLSCTGFFIPQKTCNSRPYCSLEINIFGFENDGEKWSGIYFEIHKAPLEIPANLPGQFSPNGQIFWHWAAATLKGLGEFQNQKI